MSGVTAHIINHTHWDREWFLTSESTNRWIGGLIDKVARLGKENPAFRYFLDGQTLVIEDLLELDAGYQGLVKRLIRQGNLLIGPYYCQPDWRLTGGEALLRNLLYGRQDMQKFGAHTQAGWLVDTFGHISQAPQLHLLFDIPAVYIWRGAPAMAPYFEWQGSDGSRLFTINLFGGYRNLYGVTRTPEIGVARLLAELDKLRPYYPTPDVPLFDGYDLENDPEDPMRFYQARASQLPGWVQLEATTPGGFASEMSSRLEGLVVLTGELISGKYGAVFPGSLSTRTYLKVMASDCENMLYRLCEPLAVLSLGAGRAYPAEKYEAWGRALLRNSVHDCICGVSIDQVHEKMEYSYRQVFEQMEADLHDSLAYLMGDYPPGLYCVSANPFQYEGWQVHGERLYPMQAQGVGVWKAGESIPVRRENRPVGAFHWQNEHYRAQVGTDGRVRVGQAVLGALLVYEEGGDTYSEEPGRFLGALQADGMPVVEQESELHAVVRVSCSLGWQDGQASAVVRLTFDRSPLLRWQVDLEGRGVDYRVEMVFETALSGEIYAGMPFDMVSRQKVERDLLPRKLEGRLADILVGQRELGEVRCFPFHEYLAVSDGTTTLTVFARGLHASQAGQDGRLSLPLLRAVEWLAAPDLPGRSGDAGPAFYVPDARCERRVTHELAFAALEGDVQQVRLQAINAGFQNPPLLVEVGGNEPHAVVEDPAGKDTPVIVEDPGVRDDPSGRLYELREDIPMSSLHYRDGMVQARFFNPGETTRSLSRLYQEVDLNGKRLGMVEHISPGRILTVELPERQPAAARTTRMPVKVYNAPVWRVGANRGAPEPVVLDRLRESIERLEGEIAEAATKTDQAKGGEAYRWQHRFYVLHREQLEYRLSLRLNEIKLGMGGKLSHEYLYEPDEQVDKIGYELNQLRIQRRIYDYVVQMGEKSSTDYAD